MFPILVRFFSEKDGVKVKVIDLVDAYGESSEIIVNLLNSAMNKLNINKKLVAFCGDNAACNFGNVNRTGTNNVFYKLKQLYPGLIGVGCAAHIVHNTLKKACDKMPFDVEMIVVKIYSHFYLFTVRVAKLKKVCESVDVEYKKQIGYSKTRFLGLLSSVDSILRIFDGLKEYFLGDPNTPKSLLLFFEDPRAKMWLLFLRDQATIFTAKYIATNNHFDLESSDTDLFDQFTYLERFVTEEKIQSWEENGTATDQR
ncbi:uncharacterized protein LOC120770336 [Bactrocera tryoni]|uniref:uncharacterized protein LOC120770336 n=1 Tax=Bactrocera tryoni TaxID=59916 RepID=UPI001A962C77|nr:uncharacterized protein LOC120770336 [Bactrocera tryoni]